ncbi:MAG: ATPase [Bacteroidales bacterium]|nr:ATPase [Bacteroidales bacterium]MCF8350681.1 ATPase [Bacteroidales bacterium]MCF8376974.1 ATPase [Bacteroidales bacterium]MCF8400873.1 ATPase [Bacteroidales bacterium]
MGLTLVFFRELVAFSFRVTRSLLNPAQLFISSFLIMIFAGGLILLLPNATKQGITLTNAFFTSTSAVCVTGLIVVDTGSYFTLFGQSIILLLIQAGGIGIMTFTSYFGYFFRGNTSFENQLILKDITNSKKIAEVFGTLGKVIMLTFFIEIVGAAFIYFNLDENIFNNFGDKAFFSMFHSISGFCNAGFSTLQNSLYEEAFRFNYPLHLCIAFLFIIGGLGFPITFNFIRYLKHLVSNRLFRREKFFVPWIININTRIVMITTMVLLIIGTIMFYFFEYNNTLAEHNGAGKIITAFFGAATPRTAGFNTVNTVALHTSTVFIIIFLMWVGASPASTGGGIKTSSLAIALMNVFSTARGKNRVEIFRREISQVSINRSSSVILLSFLVIGFAVFLISSLEKDIALKAIIFETFSAFSTVGLSLGITSQLSEESKWVIIVTMFVGRVGTITVLAALMRKIKPMKYRYPTEDILIN